MGDSGAMLLGFSLAAVSVEGLLKTAATVALFFPLLVLAVPILDTSFVVARRLKYRMPITTPDKTHLHHRFVNLGFSQPRAVLYIYFWVATLAAAALGTRFIPFREDGRWHALADRRRRRARARSRSPPPSTWSTCSRSSSSRTRAVRRRRREAGRGAATQRVDRTSSQAFRHSMRRARVTNSPDMLAAQMQPARQTFDPAGAGALLVTGTAAGIARWRPDRLGGRVARPTASSLGAVVGIPLGHLRGLPALRGGRFDAVRDSSPRAPSRATCCPRSPAASSSLLALPVFIIAGWPIGGWALATVLYVAVARARSDPRLGSGSGAKVLRRPLQGARPARRPDRRRRVEPGSRDRGRAHVRARLHLRVRPLARRVLREGVEQVRRVLFLAADRRARSSRRARSPRGDFDPTTEFEQHEWVSIHLGSLEPLDHQGGRLPDDRHRR